jgi:hypothetical protein
VTVVVIVAVIVIVTVLVIDWSFFTTHMEFGGAHPRAGDSFGPDVIRAGGQAAQCASKIVERQTGVEQRAKDHVASRT